MADLPDFLRSHKVEKGATFTHTCMGGNGAYFIPEDELDTFYSLYVEHIENNQGALHLTEKSTRIGPLRVDLDFIYAKEITKHQHTQDQVLNFLKAYMSEVQKLVDLPENVEIYVTEKPRPTLDKERSKSGIHLIIPDIKVNKYIETTIRRNLLTRMPEFFPGLPLSDPWDKVYDTQPLSHTAQWTLYGSLKQHGLPYKIAYVVDWTPEGMSVDSSKHEFNVDLVKRLSVRADDDSMAPLTDYGKRLYETIPLETGTNAISGGRAVTPMRGRQLQRNPGGSRGSSPGAGLVQRPLTDEEKEYYSEHIKNLASFRAENYEEWIRVGICLKNIHVDLLEVFLDFSSQSEKYNERDCIQKWDGLAFKSDGQRIEVGTLRFWSRTDNPEGFEQIESNNILRLIDECVTETEHDVARVVHAKFRDTYKCVKFANNVWYRYTGHIWEETDKGVHLQCKLSSEIWKLFQRRKIEFGIRLTSMDTCGHKKQERDMTCSFCKTSYMEDALNGICKRLKTTKFKDNVMKECRELFLDEKFAILADENKTLIAFNNGVYDTTTYTFRDGKPEDYITFSTRIDYDHEMPHEAHACWPEIRKLLENVLPDKEVRDYFVKHLATLLVGGNEAQKFHILTGSGSNGKSMLMNLVTTALGDYACKVPISLLTQGRNKSSAASPEVIRMKGKRFVTMQEPDEGVVLNSGLMKEFASGEKITARDLYAGSKAMVDFDVQAKMHLACNEKPKIQTTDGGTWRRLVVIDFPTKFVAHPVESYEMPMDESLQHKVVSEAWAKCFLRYMVQILEDGKGHRKLVPPKKVMSYTNEYQAENDTITRFIQDHIQAVDTTQETKEREEFVSKSDIAKQYKEWKRVNDIKNGNILDLTKKLEAKFGKPSKDGWKDFRLERLI